MACHTTNPGHRGHIPTGNCIEYPGSRHRPGQPQPRHDTTAAEERTPEDSRRLDSANNSWNVISSVPVTPTPAEQRTGPTQPPSFASLEDQGGTSPDLAILAPAVQNNTPNSSPTISLEAQCQTMRNQLDVVTDELVQFQERVRVLEETIQKHKQDQSSESSTTL